VGGKTEQGSRCDLSRENNMVVRNSQPYKRRTPMGRPGQKIKHKGASLEKGNRRENQGRGRERGAKGGGVHQAFMLRKKPCNKEN